MLTGSQMRRFYVTLLTNCTVSNPAGLWERFRRDLGDDYKGKDVKFRDRRALFHIHKMLVYRRRTLADFGLERYISTEELAEMEAYRPPLQLDTDAVVSETTRVGFSFVFIFAQEEARQLAADTVPQLTGEQREAFDKIVKASTEKTEERLWALEGSGGTGKTFLYKALYYHLTAQGLNVGKPRKLVHFEGSNGCSHWNRRDASHQRKYSPQALLSATRH